MLTTIPQIEMHIKLCIFELEKTIAIYEESYDYIEYRFHGHLFQTIQDMKSEVDNPFEAVCYEYIVEHILNHYDNDYDRVYHEREFKRLTGYGWFQDSRECHFFN